MKKNTENKSTAETLCQKAEELLKTKSEAKILELIGELAFQNEEKAKRAAELIAETAKAMKITHELEVHQIELKVMNEEFILAKEQAEVDAKKYVELYDFAPSGYLTLSIDGRIIGINLIGANMLGKERLYLQGAKFEFFVSEDTKQTFNLFLEKAFGTKAKESCEIILTSPGNQPMFVHLSGVATENGMQCMVTAVDITPRKQAENEIWKKSAILNNLIINLQEGILLEDSNRKIALTNQLFCDMFAIPAPPEALTGADCSESAEQNKHFFSNPEEFVDGINLILANKKAVYNDELELLDGRHFERDYIPTWFNEVYSGHLWKYRDITERKHAQQELQASEERYHSIFQGSPDGILIAEAETKMITYSNAAQCHAFGYTEEQFKTKTIADIHPEDTLGHTLAEFESLVRGEKEIAENIQCLKSNGEIFYADIRGALISLNGRSQLLGFFRDITARKMAEDELRKRSQAIEQSPVIIYITNPGGIIEYANPKATEVSGYSNKELVGQNPRIFSSGEKPKEEYKTFWQAISSGKEWKGEFHNKRKNGGLYWVAASISPVINNIGKVTHYLTIEEDITERKIAEQKIHDLNTTLELTVNKRTAQYKEALGRLEKIADRVPGVVYQYQLNPDGSSCFPYASEGIRDIYRVSPEEVAHDASIVFTRIHPDDFEGAVASIQASGKDLTLWQQEYRVRFDDGTVRWLSGNAKPQAEADGTILWHGYISDITESKLAEKALLESEIKHSSMIFNISDVIGIMGADGKMKYKSPNIEKYFGWQPQDLIGTNGWLTVHPDDLERIQIEFYNLLQKDDSSKTVEYKYKCKDGSYKPIELTAVNLVHDSIINGVLMNYHDITMRKQAEEAIIIARNEANRANLAKSEFLLRMSHELRTPMNSILGFAQLMELGDLTAMHKKWINQIQNSGKHLLNLINEVLELAGIESGKQILKPEPVRISGIIYEISDVVQILADKRNVTIVLVDSPAGNLFALADKLRLKQVLLNLTSNAIKYNRDGGSVTIKTALLPPDVHGNASVRISITDTGNGIKPEDITKLFQPFGRIGAEKTKTEGTGLGLVVVKELMKAMNGAVGLESEVGVGSTFWIELPLTENMKSDNQQHEENIKLTAGSAIANIEPGFQSKNELLAHSAFHEKTGTILYIEDNAANTELVEAILLNHRPSIQLVSHTKGAQTVSLAIEYAPVLILLDLDLPDIQGFEVIKLLQAVEKTKEIPVVVVSADAMPYQVEKLMKTGIKDYLIKPLDIKAFLQVVDMWVGK
ncbi:MAG: PAS domain S-box protein [Bacteroidales bacterium]|jgi:PAS domain S-box-containing protein